MISISHPSASAGARWPGIASAAIVPDAAWRATRPAPEIAVPTWRQGWSLRDGRCVQVRAPHAPDVPRLASFFAALAPLSRRHRFHGAVNRIPDDVLRTMIEIDPRRQLAVVVETVFEAPAATVSPLVAEARLAFDADRGEGEFALAVADDWQGAGLGSRLLNLLSRQARALGLDTLVGRVEDDNDAMLALLRGAGAVIRRDRDERSVLLARIEP